MNKKLVQQLATEHFSLSHSIYPSVKQKCILE